MATELVNKLTSIHQEVTDNIKKANQSYIKYYNQSREQQPDYNIGSKVWLSRRFITTKRPSSKLDYTKLGPFEVIDKVGTRAFRLKLPETMKIHPVFHVSLLEPFVESTIPGRILAPPPVIEVDGVEEYEVENILDSRLRRRRLEYLIDWKGYGASERTWEPSENLTNSTEIIKEFHIKYPNKPNKLNNRKKVLAKIAVLVEPNQDQSSCHPNSRFSQVPLLLVRTKEPKSLEIHVMDK